MTAAPGRAEGVIDLVALCPGAVLLHVGGGQCALLHRPLVTLLLLLETWTVGDRRASGDISLSVDRY